MNEFVATAALAETLGAAWNSDPIGDLVVPYGSSSASEGAAPDPAWDVEALRAGYVCLLPDLSILTVEGEDAVRFLHAQVTNDLAALAPGAAQWNGYCTPKGRLLATMLSWRDGDAIHLVVPTPERSALAKRLRMYVLRAKVRITENSPWLLLGLGGRAAAHGLSRLGQQAPQPMQVIQTPEFGVDRVIGLPAITPPALAMAPNVEAATRDSATPWPAGGGELHDSNSPISRSLLIVQQSAIVETWRVLTIDLTPVATGAWRFLEVLSGIPRIVAGAVDQFVPQMINLERVEGVNFRKGCYPGQEVVARSQYLGKLKRRMFLARAAGAQALPGADVYVTGRAEPAGMVVLAAMAAPGTQVILYEAPRDLVEEHIGQGGLRLHSVEGEVLQALALPYDL